MPKNSYWALILSGSGAVKSSDVKMLQFAAKFSMVGLDRHPEQTRGMKPDIFSVLMELASTMGDMADMALARPQSNRNDLLRVVALDRELTAWYEGLPQNAKWTTENIEGAGSNFFLLQYVESHHHTLAG